MSEVCTHINHLQVNQYDPTRTTALRNVFARSMRKRFRELKTIIRIAVDEQDCFGLKEPKEVKLFQLTPPGHKAFQFGRSADKVEDFMAWLRLQQEKGILEIKSMSQIGGAAEHAWTDMYIGDSYKRGVMRARYEMDKAGYSVPSIEASGGINITMSTPFHMDRVGLLYTRTFNDLKGITNSMDSQISRILAQGIADGDNPRLLAQKLIAGVDGSLDMTDTLGRFIPAERRAQILARTEIIRAHAEAQLQEFRNWGVEGVSVQAEFKTAGDERVCDICGSMEGQTFNIDEASGVIPVHPQCRCCWIPAPAKIDLSQAVDMPDTELAQIEEGEKIVKEGLWKEASNSTQAARQMMELGINHIGGDVMRTANGSFIDGTLSRLNTTGRVIGDQILSKLPKLGEKVMKGGGELSKLMFDTSLAPRGMSSVTLACYEGASREIRIGFSALTSSRETLTLAGPSRWTHSVGTNFSSTLRHEYGHHIYYNNLSMSERTGWKKFFDEYTAVNIKNNVSFYASTNAEEAFAECFSAYTSPLYRTHLTKDIILELPGSIENKLTSLIGKRIDL